MRWLRFLLVAVAALIGAVAGTVLAVALNVATGGTARRFPTIEHHPWRWTAGSTVAVAAAALLVWWAQRNYDRITEPQSEVLATDAPARGRLVSRWDPLELGVHQVIGGGPMPAYINRAHDEQLRVVLDPTVTASRLVVVRGESSTGKSRAAYEAVASRLPDWQLDYPLTATALAARLEAGIPPQTVLWLGELRQYADDDNGPAVLGRLADLLDGDGHLVVITTTWPERWATYAAAAQAGPGIADPAGTTGRLLERLPELAAVEAARINPARGGVIDIPDRFTTAETDAAVRAGDPVLAAAAAAAANAGQGGQVTQYLAGVPHLIRRYAGPGGDPYGQAIIAAAMDATRLGHATPLPGTLLENAAVGYLTGPQRTSTLETWGDAAIRWATEKLSGAVQALQPVPPATGTGVAGYQVADYLNQHGRRTRHDQLGPAALWDALTAHTTGARDLARLGRSAQGRGLYSHAEALWTAAASRGSAEAARDLVNHLHQASPYDAARAARWAASRVSLADAFDLWTLLQALHNVRADDAIRVLANRIANADLATLRNPRIVAQLVEALRMVGASSAARALATRAAGATVQASPDDPGHLAELLQQLRMYEADDIVGAILARDPASRARFDEPLAAANLLRELREAGASDAACTLAIRAANQARLDDPGSSAILIMALRDTGADDAVEALLARDPIGHARIDEDPLDIVALIREMRQAGADQAPRILTIQPSYLSDPAWLLEELRQAEATEAFRILAGLTASQVPLTDPDRVARLLRELRWPGADDAVHTLLARDPASHVDLSNPWNVALLLEQLRETGDGNAVSTLLARDPASHARLGDAAGVGRLLKELRKAGASQAARTLADRAARQVSLDDPGGTAKLLEALQDGSDGSAVSTLLARDPASHARLDDPRRVSWLLEELLRAGASDAARTLAAEASQRVRLDDRWSSADLLNVLREAGCADSARILAARAADAGMFDEAYPGKAVSYPFGREPDGTPSRSRTWQEPVN